MKHPIKVLLIALLLGTMALAMVLPASAESGYYTFVLHCEFSAVNIAVGGINTGTVSTPEIHFFANGSPVANALIPAGDTGTIIFNVAAGTVVTATVDGFSKVYSCNQYPSAPSKESPTCAEMLGDNRMNNYDCGAPIAIYPGSLEIYSVDPDTGEGVLALRVSDELMGDPTVPEVNTLLAEGVQAATGQPIQLWRLSTGEFQINVTNPDGSFYTYIWEHSDTH